MRVYEIILKKRNGEELTREEIEYLISGFTCGAIPDYQMAAWCMAVYFQGMSERETADLTLAMADSGDKLDLSAIPGCKVDKHSTGGVGDKTSLVLAPLVAAAGLPVAKMSGRGLGHTGGTIDKLESIPGFTATLSKEQFMENVRRIGMAIGGQTGNLAPADKKLYALRDVTATVDSIPLIASSIMSKKLAAGSDAIVLDVKTGRGAFMSELEQARKLAQAMVNIGQAAGRRTVAFVTDMNQPLGRAVGNALEVKEAIATLQGQGPEDLRELCLTLGTEMLLLAGRFTSRTAARDLLEDLLDSGRALAKLREFVAAQGGDPGYVDRPEKLPAAREQIPVRAARNGYVVAVDALEVGLAAMALGAGREKKDDVIDPAVGIVLKAKAGDRVQAGECLAVVHASNLKRGRRAAARVEDAFEIGDAARELSLIYSRVGG